MKKQNVKQQKLKVTLEEINEELIEQMDRQGLVRPNDILLN